MARPERDAEAGGDIAAIMGGIVLKMAVDLGAEVVRVDGAVGLRYAEALLHPWPRAVELEVEILAKDLISASEARARILTAPNETHRVSVFDCDVRADAAAIERAGYDGCWNTAVLAASLGDAPRLTAADLAIERVERADQIDELNALDPDFRSYPLSLGRPEFVDLLGRHDGRAIAKGQLVRAGRDAAYVADMFTHSAARGAGYASAILSALHDEAAALGAKRTVLIPSQTASESGFYEKRGYRWVCSRAVLLSKA